MSHFQKRCGEGSGSARESPSNVLSINSKDRFKAMKKEFKLLKIKSESEDSVHGDITACASMERESGKNSYVDLYGVRQKDKSDDDKFGRISGSSSHGSRGSGSNSKEILSPLEALEEDVREFSSRENFQEVDGTAEEEEECDDAGELTTETAPYNRRDHEGTATIQSDRSSPRQNVLNDMELKSIRAGNPSLHKLESF
jgi:hypothetical protein